MAIISWRVFNFTFEVICVLGVAVMVGYWFYKYEVEDRDIGVVDYVPLMKSDFELPVPSLCFESPVVMDTLHDIDPEINTTTYMKYLKGEIYDDRFEDIDYFNVTLDLKKYFLAAHIILSNESTSREQNITTIIHKTIFNGLYFNTFTKCFAVEINKKDLPSKMNQVSYYYNERKLLKDLGPGYTVTLNLHYPGQFLLEINMPIKYPGQPPYYNIRRYISDIEYLQRRNSRKKHCTTQSKTFDDMVWKKHITMNRCRAPYDRPYHALTKCTEKDDIQRSAFDFHAVGTKYYPKACQRISKLYFKRTDKKIKSNGYFQIDLIYPMDVRIITQSKEVDIHGLIGNIGGYIGLFLGKQVLLAKIINFIFQGKFAK